MIDSSKGTIVSIDALKNDLMYRALQAYRYTSDDVTRPYLTCLKMIVDKATMRIVATDGHALSLFETKLAYDDVKFEAYIDRNIAKQLCVILKKKRDETLCLEKSESGLKFELSNQTIYAEHCVEFEDFPPYEKVIPKENDKSTNYVAIDILQLKRLAGYLKAVFEPSKRKTAVSQSTAIRIGDDSTSPVVFRGESSEFFVKIVQMPMCA